MTRSTTINIPYTLDTSADKKTMCLYCEYDDSKTELKELCSADVHSARYDGVYNGIATDSIIIRTTVNKFSKYILSDEETSVGNVHYLKLWFPVEQLSTYYKKYNKYHVFIYTYLNDELNILYSDVINILDNRAGSPFIHKGIRYQEYCELPITCLHGDMTRTYSAQLYISVSCVTADTDDVYYSADNTGPGSSFIQTAQKPMSLSLSSDDTDSRYAVKCVLSSIWTDNIENNYINTYLSNKYFNGTTDFTTFVRCMFVDKYDENILYNYLKPMSLTNSLLLYWKDLFPDKETLKTISEDLSCPLSSQVVVIYEIYAGAGLAEEPDDAEPVITIKSSPMTVTEELWSRLCATDIYNETYTYNYSDIIKDLDNMATELKIRNTIENKVITVNQTASEGVIKPVFYRAYELDNIVLHSDIEENILINLDGYLSAVSTFYLKVGEKEFPEYARLSDGVVFTVSGLSGTSGRFYILDEDKKLVTSGKYTFDD